MEIKFNDLLINGYKNKINGELEIGKINALLGSEGEIVANILNGNENIINGELQINDLIVSREATKKEYDLLNEKVCVLFDDITKYNFSSSVEGFLNLNCKKFSSKQNRTKKILDALKMVGLSESVLEKNPNNLNLNDLKKVLLASALIINPDIIVLDHFDNHFNEAEKKKLQIIIKKMKIKFHKTFIILTNNADFLLSFIDNIYLVDKGVLTKKEKTFLFDKKLEKYIDIPNIIEFVHLLHQKNIKMDYYENMLDLLKAVYRDVL